MTTHSVAEAKNQLSGLIDRAINGEAIVITRHGHPVVELKAIGAQGRPMTEKTIAWLRAGRVGRPTTDKDAGQFVSEMRDEDDERLLRR